MCVGKRESIIILKREDPAEIGRVGLSDSVCMLHGQSACAFLFVLHFLSQKTQLHHHILDHHFVIIKVI